MLFAEPLPSADAPASPSLPATLIILLGIVWAVACLALVAQAIDAWRAPAPRARAQPEAAIGACAPHGSARRATHWGPAGGEQRLPGLLDAARLLP
ncbi:MAG: hypothetical protein RIS35_589 [Pseudomonadota bacterium]|jgi:hypothetical protein